eukprot:1158988-Pelagomonas_calceolata.AAC.3
MGMLVGSVIMLSQHASAVQERRDNIVVARYHWRNRTHKHQCHTLSLCTVLLSFNSAVNFLPQVWEPLSFSFWSARAAKAAQLVAHFGGTPLAAGWFVHFASGKYGCGYGGGGAR